ncbi:hypothetical protein P7C70_g9322, partial [Phenoliferia sp. Uapishka_3]
MPSAEAHSDLVRTTLAVLSAATQTLERLTLACSTSWHTHFAVSLGRLQHLESFSELAVVPSSTHIAHRRPRPRELFATIPLSALPPSVAEYALYFADVERDWIRVSTTLTEVLKLIEGSPAMLPHLSKISSAMLEFAESPGLYANRFGTGPVLSTVASTWARVSHSRPEVEVVPIEDRRVIHYCQAERWSQEQLWRTGL